MKIITFYADCDLPERAKVKQQGFDWRAAIGLLKRSAARFGCQTVVVTDAQTDIPAWLRVGNAKADGVMTWLLQAQAAAIAACESERAVMVSPDTLIAGPLDFLFGDWDVSIMTRVKPKPIVNSVIGFRPSARLWGLWQRVVSRAAELSDESKAWGADIDALVDVLGIRANENGMRDVCGVRARMMPLAGRFASAKLGERPRPMPVPIWDFKGERKALMPGYARLLPC